MLNLAAVSVSVTPGVSRNTTWVSPSVRMARALVRVVLALADSAQIWWPIILFIRVLFPLLVVPSRDTLSTLLLSERSLLRSVFINLC